MSSSPAQPVEMRVVSLVDDDFVEATLFYPVLFDAKKLRQNCIESKGEANRGWSGLIARKIIFGTAAECLDLAPASLHN